MFIRVVRRNSCPAASVTTFHPTKQVVDTAVLFACPFKLASPPGIHVTQIPKGNLVYRSWCQMSEGGDVVSPTGSFCPELLLGHRDKSRVRYKLGTYRLHVGVKIHELFAIAAENLFEHLPVGSNEGNCGQEGIVPKGKKINDMNEANIMENTREDKSTKYIDNVRGAIDG